jgi:conjugal transfer pilus assembly protein TraB
MPPGLPSQLAPFTGEALAGPSQPALVRVAIAQPKTVDTAHDGAGKSAPQTLDTYLPVSFTRGVLLGGLDAPTGGQSQTNPHPILIRLSDNSVLPNRFRAEYRECFVIAAGYGDISAERAYLRTESLSCVRADGTPLEVKIQGSVYGEDGKVGMRGRLVTKQGQMLANALLAGVVSGIGQGISTVNTSYSTSAFGQVATTSGTDALKVGLGSGIGKALDRLAQYYIKLAEQTFPVIEVDAGREIDVVITKGVRIEGVDTANASPTSHPRRAGPAERYMKVNDDED